MIFLLCLPQPLGSFPHMCPDGAVWLSGGSQLHLGDTEAGLQEDALPRESVRPVQPQLFSQHKFTSCCTYPATDRHADHDWALLVLSISGDWRGVGGCVRSWQWWGWPQNPPHGVQSSWAQLKPKATDLRGTNNLIRIILTQSHGCLWQVNQYLLWWIMFENLSRYFSLIFPYV